MIILDDRFLLLKKNVNKRNLKLILNYFEKEKDVCLLGYFNQKKIFKFLCTGKFYRLMKQGMSGEEALEKLNVSSNQKSKNDDDDDDDNDEDYVDDDSDIDEDELS